MEAAGPRPGGPRLGECGLPGSVNAGCKGAFVKRTQAVGRAKGCQGSLIGTSHGRSRTAASPGAQGAARACHSHCAVGSQHALTCITDSSRFPHSPSSHTSHSHADRTRSREHRPLSRGAWGPSLGPLPEVAPCSPSQFLQRRGWSQHPLTGMHC